MKISRYLFLPALLAGLILAAGCAPAAVTPDLDQIKTSAVETVMAQATLNAVLAQPTSTSAPTETLPPAWTATLPPPTATVVVVKTNTAQPTPTTKVVSSVGSSSGGSSSGGTAPTTKPTNYACKLVSQSPADGRLMKAREPFDGRFTVKNTGTATWTTDEFQFFHKSGEEFSMGSDGSFITEEVEPGDSYTFVIDLVAPAIPGVHVGWWNMRSDNNEYFCSFYVAIKVE